VRVRSTLVGGGCGWGEDMVLGRVVVVRREEGEIEVGGRVVGLLVVAGRVAYKQGGLSLGGVTEAFLTF